MWGWSVSKDQAFSILDYFYQSGGRYIDTAHNYPINAIESDLNKSFLILSAWCKSRNITDLKVTYKVGSITNTRIATCNLSRAYMHSQHARVIDHIGANLNCIMLHWDNREDVNKIQETCQYLIDISRSGTEIGLSGIKHPDIYMSALAHNELPPINIQVKENIFFSGSQHYKAFNILKPKYWAYGISGGGLKLDKNEYRNNSYFTLTKDEAYHDENITESIASNIKNVIDSNTELKNLYHLSISYAEKHPSLFGYLVAPSKLSQMKDIVALRELVNFDQIDISEINVAYPS